MSLLDTLLGIGWQQTDRLLTLHTPLGPNVLLAEHVRIEEALGPLSEHAGFRIELSAISANAYLSLGDLMGQPVRLELQTAFSRVEKRPFHGHVTLISNEGADGGFGRYSMIIEPWLAFLGKNRDSYIFQDKTVIEIVDEVLSGWQGQGKLAPAWRWDLAEAGIYPKRSLTLQYGESDLAFLKRLLAEEGIFCWFEHASGEGENLGQHTLVLADHNAAFGLNPQAQVRFTQAGATLTEDSLDRWSGLRQLDTTESHALSWDYRSLSTRPQSQPSRIDNGRAPKTEAWHDAGQYAWPNQAWGETLLMRHREALDVRHKTFLGEGTLRTAAPGRCFDLAEHPEHSRDPADQRRFLIHHVTHQARNNLGAGVPLSGGAVELSEAVDFYRCQLQAVRAQLPWRPLFADGLGRHLHPRPTVTGIQSAVVLAAGEPTHSDRDLRIKIQFPWQRGSLSAARQTHPSAQDGVSGSDNAPANDQLGTWVRVATPVAGANWGGHFTPRPGQEVLVHFLHGNIDRPVVTGTLYNGQGQADSAGNQIGGTTMNATANAPAFFAGEAGEHAHGAALSGLKTQAVKNSQDGQGGYNQLIFDDTPGQARAELATTQHSSRLQLGHLKQQSGNARQADRGHGGELATEGSLALRAGYGLLISADARPQASSTHLDSREAIAATRTAAERSLALGELAQKQNAALPAEKPAAELPSQQAWQNAETALSATASLGKQTAETQGDSSAPKAADGKIKTTQGGFGTVPAWSQPRLHFSAPAGIAQLTPKNQVLVAGATFASSSQDYNLAAQGQHRLSVKDGIVLFAAGQNPAANSPIQDTGIHLHAASGKVSLQSQSGKTAAAADKTVTIASTQGSIEASAKTHLLATAQGAYLKIEGGNIELHAPGKVEFKSGMKNWTGPKSASAAADNLPKAGELKGCAQRSAKGLDAIAEF